MRWKIDIGMKLTCGGGEEDAEDGEEVFSRAVIWLGVAAEQPGWVADEAVLCKSSSTQIYTAAPKGSLRLRSVQKNTDRLLNLNQRNTSMSLPAPDIRLF